MIYDFQKVLLQEDTSFEIYGLKGSQFGYF